MIRKARASDLDAIQNIARAAYIQYVPLIGKAPAPMVADFAAHLEAGELWLEDQPPVVGYIVFRIMHNTGFIENVAVEPSASSQGIGSRLVAFAEDKARGKGATRMELYTNIHMVKNLGYYARRGYSEIDRRTENGFERAYFEKPLSTDFPDNNS